MAQNQRLHRPGDVPTGVVVGLVVVLAALFVPLVRPTGMLPDGLPPLEVSYDAVNGWHAQARAIEPPSFLLESYERLVRASSQHGGTVDLVVHRDFAAMLIDATDGHPDQLRGIREWQLRRFLAASEGEGHDPLADVAARHGLLDRSRTRRETLMAWFDLRWETYAAREVLRGADVPLELLFSRIPAAERRVHLAWVLSATCAELTGAGPITAVVPGQLTRCAEARRTAVDMATALEPSYPAGEARAAVEAMYAADLVRASNGERDESLRGAYLDTARTAMETAHRGYAELDLLHPSRRLFRLVAGTTEISVR